MRRSQPAEIWPLMRRLGSLQPPSGFVSFTTFVRKARRWSVHAPPGPAALPKVPLQEQQNK